VSLLRLLAWGLLTAATIQAAVIWWRYRSWRIAVLLSALLIAGLPGLIQYAYFTEDRSLRLAADLSDLQLCLAGVFALMAIQACHKVLKSNQTAAVAHRASEDTLSTILENVPDPILTVDREGVVLFLNHSDAIYTVEDLVGKCIFDILPAESRDTARSALAQAFENQSSVEIELPMTDRDGSQRWYSCRMIGMSQMGDQPTAMVIATNITDRKAVEEELRQSYLELENRVRERTRELALANQELRSEIIERNQTERRLSIRIQSERLITEISTRFINLDDDQVETAINDTLRRIGELAGTDHCFICQIDGDPPMVSMTHEWHRPGVMPVLAAIQDIPLKEYPWFWEQILDFQVVRVPDRESLPPQATSLAQLLEEQETRSMIAVPLTAGQALWGFLGFSLRRRTMDWTEDTAALLKIVGEIVLSALERQRADRAIQETEARFKKIFQGNIIGSIYTNLNGTMYDANDTFMNITGYSRKDLPLNWRELTPPEWREADNQAAVQLLKQGFVPPREKEYFRKDGSRVPILMGLALLNREKGDVIGYVVDITERKQAAQRIRELTSRLDGASRLSVMGEMTAGLAHELHQPLAVIANYANGCIRRLEKESLDREALVESLQEVAAQSVRAGEILRRTRDFLRRRDTERQLVSINNIVNDAVHLAEINSHPMGIEIVPDLKADPPEVFGDAVQLTQTVLNLIFNGIQASAENANGAKTVWVSTSMNADSMVEVRVLDSGKGISADTRDSIFDQFFTTKPDGLGMGLAICKSTVENHRGQIWINPTTSQGAEFAFALPPGLTSKPQERPAEDPADFSPSPM